MFTHLKKYQVLSGKYKVFLRIFFWGLFFAFIGYFDYQRTVSFGCFDDCFNFVGAYFMLKGKILYSQAFYNHQPLAAYISYLIQFFSHPKTIYQLILDHRIFVFLFSVLFDLLLIKRFKQTGIFFVIFYELTKYYLFGKRFLA